jgi:hypothetical protein
VKPASLDSKNADGLRAVCDTPATLPHLCHHALYEIYVNGQYAESLGNLGENAQRALAFYRRKRRKQALEVRVQPCRLPGCTWGRS